MVERRFSMKQALRVFAIVREKGVRDGEYHDFQSLRAWASFDGYTVELSDGQVTLQIFFHNTYDIKFTTEHQLEQFQLKLDQIERDDESSNGESMA